MTIPHVIEWHEGAPEKLEAGMVIRFKDSDGSLHLVGHDHGIEDCELDFIELWAQLIKPHELTWAASMAQRQLAK